MSAKLVNNTYKEACCKYILTCVIKLRLLEGIKVLILGFVLSLLKCLIAMDLIPLSHLLYLFSTVL